MALLDLSPHSSGRTGKASVLSTILVQPLPKALNLLWLMCILVESALSVIPQQENTIVNFIYFACKAILYGFMIHLLEFTQHKFIIFK